MDLFNTAKNANILPFDGEVNYYGSVMNIEKAQHYYDKLFTNIQWENEPQNHLVIPHLEYEMTYLGNLFGKRSLLYPRVFQFFHPSFFLRFPSLVEQWE